MKMLTDPRTRLARIALIGAAMLFVPLQSFARDVTLVWAANPEAVTGYKLYYNAGTDPAAPLKGTGLQAGDAPIVLGNVTTYTVTGLSPSETYHFALTAYREGEESAYSTVVTVQPGTAPKIIQITNKG